VKFTLFATRIVNDVPVTVFKTETIISAGETSVVEIPKATYGSFYIRIEYREGIAGILSFTYEKYGAPPTPPEQPPTAPPEQPPEQPPELPTSPWDALKDLMRRVLRDEEPVSIDPFVTKALISVMFTILVYTIGQLDYFVAMYALVPSLLFTQWYRLITSMFMHASWEHYIGNMLFLFVFGDNVEERLGYLRYFLFYLGAGIVAGLGWVAYAIAIPGLADVPCVGASGAISGVMGAYAVFFPRARVVFMGKELPAQVFLVLWFLSQFALAFELTTVAWMAHVAGFVFGAATAYAVEKLEQS
jgi:membrane associated rhomboid family serine protease